MIWKTDTRMISTFIYRKLVITIDI